MMNKQIGSSMVEVLVTVFIIAIGLLGVAGLQSAGLRQTATSQMDAHSQLLVQDLAEMIIAFDTDATGTYDFSHAFSDAALVMGTDCVANTCSDTQLAQYHFWLWDRNMDPELPSYAIDIDFDAATRSYEISLTWDINRDGGSYAASTCTAADGLNPGCFAMLVEL